MTRRITAAFDVDGTLIDENDEPRQDIISVLRALMPYCDIVVWSGSRNQLREDAGQAHLPAPGDHLLG